MTVFENPLIVAGLTAILMWILGWIRTWLAKRVRVASPEARALARLSPLVETMMDNQDMIFDAIDDVAGGKTEEAKKKIETARRHFLAGLKARALPKPEAEERLEELKG